MPLPNSIIATLSPNSCLQVTFILTLLGWTHKHPVPEVFPAVVHLIAGPVHQEVAMAVYLDQHLCSNTAAALALASFRSASTPPIGVAHQRTG